RRAAHLPDGKTLLALGVLAEERAFGVQRARRTPCDLHIGVRHERGEELRQVCVRQRRLNRRRQLFFTQINRRRDDLRLTQQARRQLQLELLPFRVPDDGERARRLSVDGHVLPCAVQLDLV